MNNFEIIFYIGDTKYQAKVNPEQMVDQLVYNCIINDNIVLKIRKNRDNKWENTEGNISAVSKLVGWEIDNYLKKKNLKGNQPIDKWDIQLN